VTGITLPHSDGRTRVPGAAAPQPHLFLALEADRPLAPSARYSLARLDALLLGRGGERALERTDEAGVRQLRLRFPDRWMSGSHAQLTKVLGRWVVEDAGSKNGTFVNGHKIQNVVLADGDLVELGHTFFLYRDAVPTLDEEPEHLEASALGRTAPGLMTMAPDLAREFALLGQVARSPVAVVIRGDSGTGKELVARAVHALSGRPGAFVAMNCGALPDTLVETELFGYRKGAFSGADEDRPGLIRAADRGTLFLDEIGDLPAPSQAAFLRVLQEQEVVPVGSTKPVRVDLRLCAATHRDLEQMVAGGELRPDLFARVSGFTMTLPPLRARREDLGLIVAALLRRLVPTGADEVTFSCDAARALLLYGWPLNVRELEKCLGAAVVLAGREPVALWHLPEPVRAALNAPVKAAAPGGAPRAADRPLSEDDADVREQLVALLAEHHGNISAVARVMGKARMQIQRWVKRFSLDPEQYR
jgi:transcriptional regulator with GAF, ATPase, and Fis domain